MALANIVPLQTQSSHTVRFLTNFLPNGCILYGEVRGK